MQEYLRLGINRSEFKKHIVNLGKAHLRDDAIEDNIKKLGEIYGCVNGSKGNRHLNSDIYGAISDIALKDGHNINILTDNIETLYEESITIKNNNLKYKIITLYDQVNLEVSKYNANSDLLQTLNTQIKFSKNLEKENKKLNNTLKEQTEKIKEMQKQYITILGIFAAIVVSATAAISVTSSTLQSFHLGSIYRLSAVTTSLVFVMFNVMYIMTRFIQEINKKDNEKIKYPMYMWVLNIICAVIILRLIVYGGHADFLGLS